MDEAYVTPLAAAPAARAIPSFTPIPRSTNLSMSLTPVSPRVREQVQKLGIKLIRYQDL